MQDNHPYQDQTGNLTNNMHVEGANAPDGTPEAEVVVPEEYAAYVNDGTSRNRAYPFMPLGEYAAEEALHDNTAKALARYAERITR